MNSGALYSWADPWHYALLITAVFTMKKTGRQGWQREEAQERHITCQEWEQSRKATSRVKFPICLCIIVCVDLLVLWPAAE